MTQRSNLIEGSLFIVLLGAIMVFITWAAFSWYEPEKFNFSDMQGEIRFK